MLEVNKGLCNKRHPEADYSEYINTSKNYWIKTRDYKFKASFSLNVTL